MQNKLKYLFLLIIKSNWMILVLGMIAILNFTHNTNCSDYKDLYKELDIKWDLNPNNILSKYEDVKNIFWFGRIEDTYVADIPSGKVVVLWFFSHHAFLNPGPKAIKEPFHVKKDNSGYFLITITLQNTTVSEAEAEWTKKLQTPYYVLVAGKPIEIGTYKGIETIVIRPTNWYLSDSFEIIYEEIR